MVFCFVQRGDTLYHIARRYRTTAYAIKSANRLSDPNGLAPGQALVIPEAGQVPNPPPGGIVHLVRPGETTIALADRFGTTVEAITRCNQLAHPEFLLPGQQVVIPEGGHIGSDWPMQQRTPDRCATADSAPVPPFELKWTLQPKGKARGNVSSPAVKYHLVFLVLPDGGLYAISAASGQVQWRQIVTAPSDLGTPDRLFSSPAVTDGIVFVGGDDGGVYAFDVLNGRLIWRSPTGDRVTSSPALSEGLVFVGSWDACVYAFEARTGAVVWRTPTGGPVVQGPAVGGDTIFAFSRDGCLYAFDMFSGSILWKKAAFPAGAGPAFTPVAAGSLVVVGNQAFASATGNRAWEAEVTPANPAVAAGRVFYGEAAVELVTGQVLWRWSPGESSPLTPIVGGGLVYAPGRDRRLYTLAAETGQVAWQQELPEPAGASPALTPGLIVVPLESGGVLAFKNS